MTTVAQPDELAILTQALQSAEREWRELLAEQRAVPWRIHQATRLGHREEIISLQQRQDELPQRIASAEAKVLQFQIRLLEIEQRVVEETQRKLQQGMAGTWDAYQAARAQWEEAIQVQAAVETRHLTLERRRRQLNLQLERARSQASDGQRPKPDCCSDHR